MVKELYDFSLIGGTVITTYFDLDGNEVQGYEIDYDHAELLNTETLSGRALGTPTKLPTKVILPKAENQIPEIAAKAKEARSQLKAWDAAVTKLTDEDIKVITEQLRKMKADAPTGSLPKVKKATESHGSYSTYWRNALLSTFVGDTSGAFVDNYETNTAGVAGVDIVKDIGDIGYGLYHWEWTWAHTHLSGIYTCFCITDRKYFPRLCGAIIPNSYFTCGSVNNYYGCL